jgi:hypothetical protein
MTTKTKLDLVATAKATGGTVVTSGSLIDTDIVITSLAALIDKQLEKYAKQPKGIETYHVIDTDETGYAYKTGLSFSVEIDLGEELGSEFAYITVDFNHIGKLGLYVYGVTDGEEHRTLKPLLSKKSVDTSSYSKAAKALEQVFDFIVKNAKSKSK